MLSILAGAFATLGRLEDALEVVGEAIALQRDIATAATELAWGGGRQSLLLSRMGRREEAADTAREAVALWREPTAARQGPARQVSSRRSTPWPTR